MSLPVPAVTRVQGFMARSAGVKAVAWSPSSSRDCGSKPKAADYVRADVLSRCAASRPKVNGSSLLRPLENTITNTNRSLHGLDLANHFLHYSLHLRHDLLHVNLHFCHGLLGNDWHLVDEALPDGAAVELDEPVNL